MLSLLNRQSYDVQIDLELDGLKATNTLDLKNPYFRYTGQNPQPPPGHHTSAPSDSIWTTIDATLQTPTQRVNGVGGVNGVDVGLVDMNNIFTVREKLHDSILVSHTKNPNV